MTLFKTSILNGFAVLARVGTALVLNKVLAVYVGPAGYAVIGQFQSLVAMVMGIASGAIGTGVTKYTAEYHDRPELQRTVWRTAAAMALAGSAVGAALLLFAQEPLAAWLLADPAYASVFAWLALSLTLMVANGLMLAIMNGKKAIAPFVLANIAGSVIGAGVSLSLVVAYGLYGALVALGLGQAVSCLVTAWLFRKACAIRWRDLWGGFDPASARRLAGFALMAVVSAIVVPVSQMVIRDRLGVMLGLHTTGLWQAMWRISDLHLMLITSTLTVYFLPRFSELPAGPALRGEVLKAYRFVIPLVLATSTTLYLLKHILVRGLLTADFLPLTEALGWQLVGDTMKICSWVAGYTLISHARITLFMASEIVFSAILVGLTIIGAHFDGLRGTALGYTGTYLLHAATMLGLLFWLTQTKSLGNKK
ncbi:MAG: O-antigen translocase [Rubrivivax sp.]